MGSMRNNRIWFYLLNFTILKSLIFLHTGPNTKEVKISLEINSLFLTHEQKVIEMLII